MSKIYFLQVECDFENNVHYENVYSKKDIALQEGMKVLEKFFRDEYKTMFDENKEPNITRDELFNLCGIYDFTITEYDPEYTDSLNNINNLHIVQDYDIHDKYTADLIPAKIKYSYDYNGKQNYITAVYIFNYNGKITKTEIMMYYEDFLNSKAGTKFKIGDIVKIKENSQKDLHYNFYNKLHVITEIPQKKANQKFFNNTYNAIVNHNSYDEGCHVHTFQENELELYTGKLPYDSPIIFLSKYFKGEIKLENISFQDIECGRITLNESKSFRDFPEIMKQLKG